MSSVDATINDLPVEQVTKFEDVKDQTTEDYFRGNEFAIDAFNKKYCVHKGETYVQAIKRVCDYMASCEATPELVAYWSERWFDEIYNDWWHPAGSIMQGAASGRNVSMSNCSHVSMGGLSDDEEWDNLESIIKNTAYSMAKMAAFRQGLGVDVSRLRPAKLSVQNSANVSSGSVHWMKFLDSIGNYVGQCLHGSTPILTSSGYKTIADIVQSKMDTEVMSPNGPTKVVAWHSNGTKPMMKVRLQYGDVLTLSPDHKVATSDGNGVIQREAASLNVGDYVVGAIPSLATPSALIRIDPFSYPLDDYNNSNRLAYPNLQPTVINEELAYVAGLIYGDGCETDGYLDIAMSNDWPDIVTKLEDCLFKVFGVRFGDYGVNRKPGDGDCERICLGRWYTEFFRHAGFTKNKAGSLVFPEVIRSSPFPVVMSFVAGLFDADGHNSQSRRNVEITLIDKEFLTVLKQELLRHGIVTSLRQHGQKSHVYRLSIVGFASKVRFESYCPSVKIAEGNICGRYDRLKTPFFAKHLKLPYNNLPDVNGCEFLSHSKYEKYIGKPCPLYVQKIVAIDTDSDAQTFDLTILDDTHLFLAGGVLVSNSGRVPAFLLSLSIKHPDIEQFITAKGDRKIIQNANISVQVTDDFYKAVRGDKEWTLEFTIPELKKGQKVYLDVHSTTCECKFDEQKQKWYYVAKRSRKSETMTKKVSARKLLELIAQNMAENAEPGIQNMDVARKYSNSDYLYDIKALYDPRIIGSNACSEQMLSRDSVCILSSINAGRFSIVSKEFEAQFSKIGPSINRFLDNVNEMELRDATYATPHQKVAIEMLRRTGAGFTNIAGWLFKQNLEYGSTEGNEVIERFQQRYNYHLYKSSIELGREKGSFGLFNREKFEKSPFVKRMMKLGLEFDAMRNVTCSTCAPNGTLTLMFRDLLLGSGIEPAFFVCYWKRTRISGKYEYYFCVPTVVRQKLEGLGIDLGMSGDAIRDSWDGKLGKPIAAKITQAMKDHNIRFKSSTQIKPVEKLNLMAGVAKWIDSSISVTYMLPEDNDWRDVYDFILLAHEKELKSIAAYPDKKLYGIVTDIPFKDLAIKLVKDNIEIHPTNFSDIEKKELEALTASIVEDDDHIPTPNLPKRPKSLNCDVHHIRFSKKLDKVRSFDYLVVVGLRHGSPFEVFAMENGFLDKKYIKGICTKEKTGVYSVTFDDGTKIDDITKDTTESEDVFTRFVSLSLQCGSGVERVVDQLEKSEGDMWSFGKAMARALKKYIANGTPAKGQKCSKCGSSNMVRLEGCLSCGDCGNSRCS